MRKILENRKTQIVETGLANATPISCEKQSLAGSVSQRACVFCGSRVVLYPIADALHLIHGPIGCASYTWDIRGSLSSGPELHRQSFCTDLQEKDVIFGGEKKLHSALVTLIKKYEPKAAFVYSTCIVGLIGDDIEAVCKAVSTQTGVQVIPVHSEGFKGTKKDGYKAACLALCKIIGTNPQQAEKGIIQKSAQAPASVPLSINILGDFNLAGELWILKEYYQKIGITIVATATGDGRVLEMRNAHTACLNVVQCSGSMVHLAKEMKERYNIPYLRVSYFGIEDMSDSLYEVAKFFNNNTVLENAKSLVKQELKVLLPQLTAIRNDLLGKKAAIYVGGAFKAISLIKALRTIGVQTVIVGSQTGNQDDYNEMAQLCDSNTIIVDDSNPLELSKFVIEKNADILIGGVKERPIAYKLGIGFCDHNHERKEALAGYTGMLNFALEIHRTAMSPVWKYAPMRRAY
jgi:nitrogenase molybdenum-cofactor synthesis protein NifE